MSFSEGQPKFLTNAEVMLFHSLAIQEFGGSSGVRDIGLLDSAMAQPPAKFGGQWLHGSIFEMAAAYGFHLAMNHAFIDGNKRVAWSAIRAFLYRNGFTLRVETTEAVETMLAVASGSMEKSALAIWISNNCEVCRTEGENGYNS